MAEEVTGVKCGICGKEVFRLLEREARLSQSTRVIIRSCVHCARRIDMENETVTGREAMLNMSKAERKYYLQGSSRGWARSWEGKHVDVSCQKQHYWEEPFTGNIRGIASYGSKHEDVGWGRVKVVVDTAEMSRITFQKDSEYPNGIERPCLDGSVWTFEWVTHAHWNESLSLSQNAYDNPLSLYVNWGDRFTYVLAEVDPQAELLIAKQEEERREAEARKHFGEGI